MHSLWFRNSSITFPRPQETVVIEKSGFLRSIDSYLYRLTSLANTKGIQTVFAQSFWRNSATRNSFGSTVMSESCLIGVNNALTDKNEINKMFITGTGCIQWTFASFTLGRDGIWGRDSVFVWLWCRFECVGIRDEMFSITSKGIENVSCRVKLRT